MDNEYFLLSLNFILERTHNENIRSAEKHESMTMT